MSIKTNKPTQEGASQTAWITQLAGQSPSVPAFSPQIVRSVRTYPRLAACVAAVELLGLVGVAFRQKSVYLANSQVYVESIAAKVLSDPGSALFDANKYENFLAEQMQLMQRQDVLTAAMTSLPASTYREFGATPAQAAEVIQTQMKVARVFSSYQVSISLKGADAQKTAAIVNAITSAYVAAARKTSAEEYDQRAQLLGEERQRIETEVQAAQSEQTALGASIGVPNPGGESGNPYNAELNGIRLQLSEVRSAQDVAAAQLAALNGSGGSRTDGLTAAADESIAGDAGLGRMKATISQRKTQLNEQMSGMTASNPIYKQEQNEIADLDRTLDRMNNDLRDKAARHLQDKLHTDLRRTGDIESRLHGQLARQIANATSAVPRFQRAAEVAADIKRLDTRMAAVNDALRSLRMEVSGPSQVRVSLPATAPERPVASRKKLFMIIALPLALLFGAAAAILARKRDQHIYTGIDVEEVLGFPPLAILPARADVSPQVFGEYVLRLAAGIESAYRNSGARTFLLTAVSMTTDIAPVTTALTRKFQEIGVNVIVTTASDMLSPIEESAATTTHTAPAGADEQVRAAGVWSEGFLAANVAKMKAEHGLVLIDSEAILTCAQTEYVARCADATILIVECGVTTRKELFLAGELLHRLKVPGVGAVLEEVQLRYADVDFRNAIDGLDRRMAASAWPERRQPAQRVVVVDLAQQRPEPTPQQAEPQVEGPVATSAEVHLEPQAAVQPVELVSILPVTALEQEKDRVDLECEPTHDHEVLHHVRASWSEGPDSGWHLPAFSPVPSTPETPAVPTDLEDVLSAAAVEIVSHTTLKAPGSSIGEPMRSVHQPSVREKIVPRLTGPRQVPEPVGDGGEARKASWLDTLLKRDSDAVVSIIPEDSDSESSPEGGQDYDIPLANRLTQISGIQTAAPAADSAAKTPPKSNLVDISHPHGVMVHSEAEVAEVVEGVVAVGLEMHPGLEALADVKSVVQAEVFAKPAALIISTPELVAAELATFASKPAPEAEVEVGRTPKKLSPSAWSTIDVEPVEPIEELAGEARRPYTFRELMERAQRVESSPVKAVATAPEPVFDSGFQILGQLSGIVPAAPAVESSVRRHDIAASATPTSRPGARVESAIVAQAFPVPEERPEPPTVWARDPEFHFAQAAKQFVNPYDEAALRSDPSRQELSEVDDVETVYQAASRRLNSGRWDAIPPLRPSMASWRDRSSPAPLSRDSGGYRTDAGVTDAGVKDAFNAYPPQRWIPEEDVFVPSEPEILSEPALSRQWGLLSKFQQSRLVASGAEAGSEASKDNRLADFDTNEPGSTRGNRKS